MKSSSDKKTGGKKPVDARESQARRCGERDKIFKLFEFIKFKKFMDVIEPTLLKSRAIRAFAFLIFDTIVWISDKRLSSKFTSCLLLRILRI